MSDYETLQRRRDLVVGLFVVVGLCAFGWLVFRFNDLPSAASKIRSFEVFVQFPAAPGVDRDTPVRFCGYQIGRVTHVMPPAVREDLKTHKEYHQIVTVLYINRRYNNIPSNVEVRLMTRGLGSSYIELKVDPANLPAPGFLENGQWLQGSTGMANDFLPEATLKKLDVLAADLVTFIANANAILGDAANRDNIKSTLANLSEGSKEITTALKRAEQTMDNVDKTLEEYRKLASTGTATIHDLDAYAEKLATSFVNAGQELGAASSQLRQVLLKVNSGQGSLGKLANDARLYESLLETSSQLQRLSEKFQALLEKINEKGLRSVY